MNEFQYHQTNKLLPGSKSSQAGVTTMLYAPQQPDNRNIYKLADSCENAGDFNCPKICEKLRDLKQEVVAGKIAIGWVVALVVIFVILIVVGVAMIKGFRTVIATRMKKKEEEEGQSLKSTPSITPSASTPHSRKTEIKAKSTVSRTPLTDDTTPKEYTPKNDNFDELLQLTKDIVRHREYVAKMEAQEKSDAKSEKFQKMGPIVIPSDTELDRPKESPEAEVILDKVYYDPKGNEVYDIGSDVDIIVNTPKRIKKEGEKDERI